MPTAEMLSSADKFSYLNNFNKKLKPLPSFFIGTKKITFSFKFKRHTAAEFTVQYCKTKQ